MNNVQPRELQRRKPASFNVVRTTEEYFIFRNIRFINIKIFVGLISCASLQCWWSEPSTLCRQKTAKWCKTTEALRDTCKVLFWWSIFWVWSKVFPLLCSWLPNWWEKIAFQVKNYFFTQEKNCLVSTEGRITFFFLCKRRFLI